MPQSPTPSWSTELFKTAQNSPCYGEDNDNPRKGVAMFRHYYVRDDGITGHTLQAVDIEFDNVMKQEVDKEGTVEKAKSIFKRKTPDDVELLKTELAGHGEINHPLVGKENEPQTQRTRA